MPLVVEIKAERNKFKDFSMKNLPLLSSVDLTSNHLTRVDL